MKKTYYLLLLSLTACQNQKQEPLQAAPHHFIPHTKAEKQHTFHTDTTCKYEYRTGESGGYQYNYDVFGTDYDGNEVTGNISVEGKYGTGTLTTTNGGEIKVEVEWTGYGELKATDTDGNAYRLETQ